MSDNATNDQTQTAGEAGSSTNVGSTGQLPQAVQSGNERTFTQAELDQILKNRLAEDRRKRDEDAKQQRAKEQGEYQSLAQQYEARIKELEPQLTTTQEQLQTRDALIEKLIAPRVKALPDELRDVLPTEIGPRVEALIKFEKAAEKLQAAATTGTPAGPRGGGAQPPITVATATTPRRVGDGF